MSDADIPFQPGRTQSTKVLFAETGALGRILLNRPKAINALDTDMCHAVNVQMHDWADGGPRYVSIEGAGDRGLCAGGDVKGIRAALLADPDSTAGVDFFRTEYAMNAGIAHYPRPWIAIMDGVTMGGGLGISAHGSLRVVTERSKLAMPETLIGFFPDVGMLHVLNGLPGLYGTHLALTGTTIDGGAALALGLADAAAPSGRVGSFLNKVSAGIDPQDLLAHRTFTLDSDILDSADWIDECYAGGSAEEVQGRLTQHADPRAREAGAAIAQRSPFAVAVTLAALRRAATMTIDEVLAQDLVLATNFLREPDFFEGVRCQLVDRGQQPRWRHRSLAEVPAPEVDAMFVG
ncbi:enoyl-CoA hydratase/isomerase family protein [Granulicoccus phenolivorans]|uniref:enoyl-CoA hydratase/isomerase family protein n=1 Tax=Granulicoccus phenolivorans TaxID=266854 RepID=UPI00040DC33E|nr:3-hydroxyisobutyryl-CoA hydrolase [Granulicoccus phenolivorans]